MFFTYSYLINEELLSFLQEDGTHSEYHYTKGEQAFSYVKSTSIDYTSNSTLDLVAVNFYMYLIPQVATHQANACILHLQLIT